MKCVLYFRKLQVTAGAQNLIKPEIRFRGERRLGELMAAQREAGDMSGGGRARVCGLQENPQSEPITLAEAGIDKNLADRARESDLK